MSAENLLNPPSKDNTAVWFKLPNGDKRVFPRHAVKAFLADKNRGWEECEPDFVPSVRLRPFDEGKTNTAVKNANTQMTGQQLGEFLTQTVAELREYATTKNISLNGCKNKKEILEAIEKAGGLK